MLAKVRSFWLRSFESDRTAFYFELVSFVFTVAASMTLAISARDPNMLIVYPGFLIGALTQCYASYRRGAAWVMILIFYFACVNIFGYGVAAGWW